MTFQQEREAVCRVGRLLYDRGYVAANDGNISVKVAEDRLLITPSGVSRGRMTPEMLLVTDMDGTVIEGDRHPSSEGKMHLEVYRGRPDVNAVVHAHPPVSTAFAVCRRGLETPYLSELVAGLGQVPCTPSFAMLSTEEVPESVRPYLAEHNALLLANHGALAWGGGIPLTEEEVSRLLGLRGMYRTLREVRHG